MDDMTIDESNKRTRLAILIVAILAIVLFVGYYSYSTAPSQKLKRQLNLGEKYLTELNYEQAVAAFKEALSIDAESAEAFNGLRSAYFGWADTYAQQGDYDTAIKLLEEANELIHDTEITKKIQEYKDLLTKEQERLAEEKEREKQVRLLEYADVYEMVQQCGMTMRPQSWSEDSVLPLGNATCFKTYSEKREIFKPIMTRLQEYMNFLMENQDDFPYLCESYIRYKDNESSCVLALDGKKYYSLKMVFADLINLNYAIGDMEGIKSIRSLYEEYFPDNMEFIDETNFGHAYSYFGIHECNIDEYGRVTGGTGVGDKPYERQFAVGYELPTQTYYTDKFFNTTTRIYNDGRLEHCENTYPGYRGRPFTESYNYEYSGDTVIVTFERYDNGRKATYYSDHRYTYLIDEYGGAHEIKRELVFSNRVEDTTYSENKDCELCDRYYGED